MKSKLAILVLVLATMLNLTTGANIMHENLSSSVITKITTVATTPHPLHLGRKR